MNKTILVTVGCAALILGGLFGFGIARSKGLPPRLPTKDEISMLLTIDSFADYGFTNMPKEACESWLAKPNKDGSTQVEYEYDSELDPGSDYIYLLSTVELNRSEADATQTFKKAIGAMKLDVGMFEGAGIEEQPNLIDMGDESYTALITSEGEPAGNIVVIRDGRIIHMLMVTGIYFDEKDRLEELFITPLVNTDPEKFGRTN